MSKQKEQWHVHAEKLRELGFSQALIAEAVRSEELGLFEIEPPEDLVERTVARCTELFPRESTKANEPPAKVQVQGAESPWCDVESSAASVIDASRLVDFVTAQMDSAHLEAAHLNPICVSPEDSEAWSAMNLAETLPLVCLGSARFALRAKQRPVVIVENHNLIDPSWWQTDVAFRSMRVACKVVNSVVVSQGAPAVAAVVILRPNISAYSSEDIQALGDLVRTSAFDIWWLPYRLAGKYVDRDVMVVGDEHVFSLVHKAQNAWGAYCNVRTERNALIASKHRAAIEVLTGQATPIRSCQQVFARLRGVFEKPERLRGFLEDVILSKDKTATTRR